MRIEVYGLPTAQGSKRAFVNRHTGKAHVVETNDAKVKTWREDVKQAALRELGDGIVFSGPVKVAIDFYFPRPKSHFRTGQYANLLKPKAPVYPTSKPDIDKVLRSTLDALTISGVWSDDRQVVSVYAGKHYVDDDNHQGAHIHIREALDGSEEEGA